MIAYRLYFKRAAYFQTKEAVMAFGRLDGAAEYKYLYKKCYYSNGALKIVGNKEIQASNDYI